MHFNIQDRFFMGWLKKTILHFSQVGRSVQVTGSRRRKKVRSNAISHPIPFFFPFRSPKYTGFVRGYLYSSHIDLELMPTINLPRLCFPSLLATKKRWNKIFTFPVTQRPLIEMETEQISRNSEGSWKIDGCVVLESVERKKQESSLRKPEHHFIYPKENSTFVLLQLVISLFHLVCFSFLFRC